MNGVPTTEPKKNRRKYWLIAGVLVLILYAPMLFRWAYQVQFTYHFLLGWLLHLKSTALPALVGNAMSLWFPLLCLLIAGALGHRFVRWWAGERGFLWKGPQTVCIFTLLVLGSAAAIAMSGVAHQLAWMGTTKMTQTNAKADLTMQVNAIRQILMVILEYVTERGGYPGSLEDLREMEVFSPGVFESMRYSEERGMGPKELVIYRKPGDEKDAGPILIGSVYGEKVVCGFADGSVRLMNLQEYENWMDKMQKGEMDEK